MLSKIFGGISFICLILVPGAVESEMYITTFVLICGMTLFAYISMKEEGLVRKDKEK